MSFIANLSSEEQEKLKEKVMSLLDIYYPHMKDNSSATKKVIDMDYTTNVYYCTSN